MQISLLKIDRYVIADYERHNFSVFQCKWEGNAQQQIVPILLPTSPANDTSTTSSTKKHSLPVAAIAGGVGGGVILFASLALLYIVLRRRKAALQPEAEARPASNAFNVDTKPELDGFGARSPVSELDDQQYGKRSIAGAVEMGACERNSVHEMAAEDVAKELPAIGKYEHTAFRRSNSQPIPQRTQTRDSLSPNSLSGTTLQSLDNRGQTISPTEREGVVSTSTRRMPDEWGVQCPTRTSRSPLGRFADRPPVDETWL